MENMFDFLPKMRKFLCFFSLRVGGIVLGICGAFMSASSMAVSLSMLLEFDGEFQDKSEYGKNFWAISLFSIGFVMFLLMIVGITIGSAKWLLPAIYCGLIVGAIMTIAACFVARVQGIAGMLLFEGTLINLQKIHSYVIQIL